MSLVELAKPSIPIYVMPQTRQSMLSDIRKRYFDEIDPELWKAYFNNNDNDDHFQECVESEFNIVGQTINKYISGGLIGALPSPQFEYLRDSLWEDSQSFLHEYAKDLDLILNFADRMHKSAVNEIKELFPNAKGAFGEMAYSLLIDLCFQYEFYRYSKLAKPDLIDLRRIINYCGQIVESIFYEKVFLNESMNIRQIIKELKSFRESKNKERNYFFNKFKNGNILTTKEFVSSLNIIMTKRNDYSHGFSSGHNPDDDFRECVVALIGNSSSSLKMLYEVLNIAAA